VYRYRYRVRFQDIDAAGIVFFAWFFEIFHDAYVAALLAGGCDLVDVIERKTWVAPLTSAHAEYRRPLRLGEQVCVEVSASRQARGIAVFYRVVSEHDPATLYATGKTEHAFVDAHTFKRCEIAAEVLAALHIE
jgi:YbgC/YbaW family acyl-CoA thioester hydrolase